MSRRMPSLSLPGAAPALLLAGLPACGSNSASTVSASSSLPTVTLMVGGIDKPIYLPYQLAQDLGFYKKYGVNMVLSTEQAGGVGAADAMAPTGLARLRPAIEGAEPCTGS